MTRNARYRWLRRLIKASRFSSYGNDLAHENPSMYYLAKSLGTMGSHYNLNLERQRQVMLSALFIGFTFSVRAALTAVLAVGNSNSNSYFSTLPNLNTTNDKVTYCKFTMSLRLIVIFQVGQQLCDGSKQPAVSIAFFWLFFSPWVCRPTVAHIPLV
jgi:hypothetical protein